MKPEKEKTVIKSMTLPVNIIESVQELAKEDSRTFSKMTTLLLQKQLKAQGKIK